MKKLYRSVDDRILAGVCGGIAEYFDISSALVRVIAIALFFGFGLSMWVYIIFIFLIPKKPTGYEKKESLNSRYDGVNYNDIKRKAEQYKDKAKEKARKYKKDREEDFF